MNQLNVFLQLLQTLKSHHNIFKLVKCQGLSPPIASNELQNQEFIIYQNTNIHKFIV